MDSKPRVMLHIIMANQISGPNTSAKNIMNSYLAQMYEFGVLEQKFHAEGRINFRLIRDLYKQIIVFDPQLIHLSGLQSSGFHAAVAARLAGKPVIMAVRGFSSDAIRISSFKREFFRRIIEPITLAMSHSIYTVCHAAQMRPEIQRFSKKVFGTIHNAAPEIHFSLKEARVKYREKLHYSGDDIVVAVSGRMIYDKGISYIAEAIEKLDWQMDKHRLSFLFIGDGEYKAILENRLLPYVHRNRVQLVGKIDHVTETLSACDIFLFATLHENLSNALLEAVAVGLPIIATNVGGNPEIVQNDRNGFLIPPADSAAIAECILTLAADPDKRKEFSICSKRIAMENFSKNELYKKLELVYKPYLDE